MRKVEGKRIEFAFRAIIPRAPCERVTIVGEWIVVGSFPVRPTLPVARGVERCVSIHGAGAVEVKLLFVGLGIFDHAG